MTLVIKAYRDKGAKATTIKDRRERLREDTLEEIKRVAWEQMAEEGPAGLSLREIAKRMGVSAPALYNYYKNRDDLITALIIEAYNMLGAAMRQASEGYAPQDYAHRLLATALAMRQWAVENREKFVLIFGTPIPGYHAPEDSTDQAARQSLSPLGQLLQEAQTTGQLKLPPEYATVPPSLAEQLSEWLKRSGAPLELPVLRLMLVAWSMVQGLISLELYGHSTAFTSEPGEFYQLEMQAFLERIGLRI